MQHNSDTTFAQPNSDITSKFDDFLLLSRGKTVYNGPWDKSVEYFTQQGYRYVCIAPLQSPWTLHTIHLPHHSCPQYTNPTDYYLSLVKDSDASEALTNAFAKHSLHNTHITAAAQEQQNTPAEETQLAAYTPLPKTSVLYQTNVLADRYTRFSCVTPHGVCISCCTLHTLPHTGHGSHGCATLKCLVLSSCNTSLWPCLLV